MSGSGREVPPGLERILRRCLEKGASERFQSAHDLAFALEALSGSGVSTKGAAVVSLAPSRRRGVRAALLALGLVALPALAYFLGRANGERPAPTYKRLTFRRGRVTSAQLTDDGRTVVYGAEWGGRPVELFSTRLEGRESRSMDLPSANVLSIASTGDMAIVADETVSRVPLAGGAPRAVLDGVPYADLTPDGKEMAIVRSTDGKARLEFPIGKVLIEAPVSGELGPLRVSPRGDRVAFGRVSGNTFELGVVDRQGAQVVLSKGWTWGGELGWSPRGDEVWFTASKGGWAPSLYAVDLAGHERVLLRLPGWPRLLDVSPEGRVLFDINDFDETLPGIDFTADLKRARGQRRERVARVLGGRGATSETQPTPYEQ